MAGKKKFGRKSAAQDNFLEPLAPTSVTATDVGTSRSFNDGAATVSFSLPANSPAATSFTATATASGQTTRTATGASSPLTITDLSSAVTYTVTVTATNAQGTSQASSSTTVTATTVPATISAPSATSTSADQDILSWTAPATGGKAITLYRWTSSDGKTGTTTNTTVTISQEGGTAQTYQVRAENANGNGVYSANSNNVTTVAPFFPPSFPFFPPFFPFFPNFAAPPFFPFFPNFAAPPFFPNFAAPPFFPNFGGGFFPVIPWSIGSQTNIIMSDGSYKPASQIQVGDVLRSIDIEEIDNENFDPSNWTSNTITYGDYVETTVVSVSSREVTQVVALNGELFSTTHWILTKKDDVIKFVNTGNLDTTYQIWSHDENNWVDIITVELLDYTDTVYSINTEPYDKFFTENALVFDMGPTSTQQ
jgi:PKD repeat protein